MSVVRWRCGSLLVAWAGDWRQCLGEVQAQGQVGRCPPWAQDGRRESRGSRSERDPLPAESRTQAAVPLCACPAEWRHPPPACFLSQPGPLPLSPALPMWALLAALPVGRVPACPCMFLHGSCKTVGPRPGVTCRQRSRHSLDRLLPHAAPLRWRWAVGLPGQGGTWGADRGVAPSKVSRAPGHPPMGTEGTTVPPPEVPALGTAPWPHWALAETTGL